MIPFLSRQTTERVLEAHDLAMQAEDEMLAEYGADAYALYGNSGDALVVARWRMELEDARTVVEKNKAAALYEAADFMTGLHSHGSLRVRSVYEEPVFGLFQADVIPEFIPGAIPSKQFFTIDTSDDIPF